MQLCAEISNSLNVATKTFEPAHEIDVLNRTIKSTKGAQWLSGRVLDSRPRSRGLEPHRRHCVVVLEQDTFILA